MADLENKKEKLPRESTDKKADAKEKKSPKKAKPKFTERVGKFFRGYRSEMKKITWCPWNQVFKSTLVVVVIAVICAAVIGILDNIFFDGIVELGKLI